MVRREGGMREGREVYIVEREGVLTISSRVEWLEA